MGGADAWLAECQRKLEVHTRLGEPFEFKRLAPPVARIYGTLWATARQALPRLTDGELALVVSLVTDTCPDCYAHNRRCGCPGDHG